MFSWSYALVMKIKSCVLRNSFSNCHSASVGVNEFNRNID